MADEFLYVPLPGERVRVIEVCPKDDGPRAKVGDEVDIIDARPSIVAEGYLVIKTIFGNTWCRVEPIQEAAAAPTEAVNNPTHYTSHPSGVECITITEHLNFCLGNAIKYIWRAGLKTTDPLKDLKKARWYIDREIARLEKAAEK